MGLLFFWPDMAGKILLGFVLPGPSWSLHDATCCYSSGMEQHGVTVLPACLWHVAFGTTFLGTGVLLRIGRLFLCFLFGLISCSVLNVVLPVPAASECRRWGHVGCFCYHWLLSSLPSRSLVAFCAFSKWRPQRGFLSSCCDMDVAKPTDATSIIRSTWLGVHWLGLPRSSHPCAARTFHDAGFVCWLVDRKEDIGRWLGSPLASLALSCVWALFLLGVTAESVDVGGPRHWFSGGDMVLAGLGSACRAFGEGGSSDDTRVQGGFLLFQLRCSSLRCVLSLAIGRIFFPSVNGITGKNGWVCSVYASVVCMFLAYMVVPPSSPALCSWGWCIPWQVSWWCVLRVRAYLLGPPAEGCLDQLVKFVLLLSRRLHHSWFDLVVLSCRVPLLPCLPVFSLSSPSFPGCTSFFSSSIFSPPFLSPPLFFCPSPVSLFLVILDARCCSVHRCIVFSRD